MFESKKWKTETDLEKYPNRELMLRDIVENKRLIGLGYSAAIDSLGPPNNYDNKKENELWYLVTIDYGIIDPIYTKHLILTLDMDSTVEKVDIKEWKKFDR